MATTATKAEVWSNDEQKVIQELCIAPARTKAEIWSKDEQQVFKELGIAPSDVSQQRLVRGIRRAIGRLVAANLEIMKALKKPGSVDLSQAEIWLNEVAGDEPPRCQAPRRRYPA
ncbi:MAG TPA: hypothetical protein VGO68_12125 [Pyrinomonadaceae bacterium]|nr:hypothetical protein [Pyrinomonadaceae bacterium]